MSSNRGGDTQVPEDDLKKSGIEVGRDKDTFLSYIISS